MLSLTNGSSRILLSEVEILRYLPHRKPSLYLEGITEIENGKRAVGIMGVYGCEYCLQGHYEGRKILPGHILLELFNQVACVLYTHSIEPSGVADFSLKGLPLVREVRIKFSKLVEPPCCVLAEVVVLKKSEHRHKREWKFGGRAYVSDTLVAVSNFTGLLDPT